MTPSSPSDAPQLLTVAHAAAWLEWLLTHGDHSDGVWLVLAKKGTTSPTSLSYQEALEEALCSGWIDGQRRGRDATTFVQRFTPRRARSLARRATAHSTRSFPHRVTSSAAAGSRSSSPASGAAKQRAPDP